MAAASSTTSIRWANRAFALSALWWAIAPTLGQESWLNPVRLTLMVLHLEAAVLFWSRAPLREEASPVEYLVCIPALVCGGLAFVLSPQPSDWPPVPVVLFVAGGIWTAVSLGWLGENFAVLPADRGCTRSGPYRVVRHPAYLGESVMLTACVWAAGGWVWLLLPVGILGVLARIGAEEQVLLRTNEEWRAYRAGRRWRLVPGIW